CARWPLTRRPITDPASSPAAESVGGKQMNLAKSHLRTQSVSRLGSLLGTASFLAIAASGSALAQGQMMAAGAQVPEQVLITGSLISGTASVGVPVTNL